MAVRSNAFEQGHRLALQAWRDPLLLTLGVRLLITIWLAAAWLVIDPYYPSTEIFQQHGFYMIPVQATFAERAFLDVWVRWDAINFLNIAQNGYHLELGSPFLYAFFPAFPMLVRALAGWMPVQALQAHWYVISGLLVSTTATFVAMGALYQLVLVQFQEKPLARWTILLWGTFPTSVFLFAPYSDSLFAAFTLLCFLFLARKQWLLAGLLCSLAGLTRSQGILVVLPVALAVMIDAVRQRRLPALPAAGALLIAPIGWLSYQFWMRAQVQNSLFDLYSTGWKFQLADPFTVFFHTAAYAFRTGDINTFFELLALLVFGLTLVWMMTRPMFQKAPELLLYAAATMGSFMVWDCGNCPGYVSSLRYILSLYPIFIGLAWLVLRLPKKVRPLIITVNISFLLVCSILYAIWRMI